MSFEIGVGSAVIGALVGASNGIDNVYILESETNNLNSTLKRTTKPLLNLIPQAGHERR